MSQKALDRHNRWRSKTVAFRMSPEENKHLDIAVRLCGLTKQDYIIQKLLNQLVVTGQLFEHLAQINREATELLDRLIAQMKKAEGVTEELKGRDQMAWVGRMNNIKARAEEIVPAEVVYYDAYD